MADLSTTTRGGYRDCRSSRGRACTPSPFSLRAEVRGDITKCLRGAESEKLHRRASSRPERSTQALCLPGWTDYPSEEKDQLRGTDQFRNLSSQTRQVLLVCLDRFPDARVNRYSCQKWRCAMRRTPLNRQGTQKDSVVPFTNLPLPRRMICCSCRPSWSDSLRTRTGVNLRKVSASAQRKW